MEKEGLQIKLWREKENSKKLMKEFKRKEEFFQEERGKLEIIIEELRKELSEKIKPEKEIKREPHREVRG